MFQTQFARTITSHVLWSTAFLRRLGRLWDNVGKQSTARRQALCMLDTWGYRHTLRSCNTMLIACPQPQQRFCERASVLASLVEVFVGEVTADCKVSSEGRYSITHSVCVCVCLLHHDTSLLALIQTTPVQTSLYSYGCVWHDTTPRRRAESGGTAPQRRYSSTAVVQLASK